MTRPHPPERRHVHVRLVLLVFGDLIVVLHHPVLVDAKDCTAPAHPTLMLLAAPGRPDLDTDLERWITDGGADHEPYWLRQAH